MGIGGSCVGIVEAYEKLIGGWKLLKDVGEGLDYVSLFG